ncbi:hypothetical protein T08_3091 [Trichinella sp. T8]|nr:hypothetical protein T08_3091 [Trichinella sp. T8]
MYGSHFWTRVVSSNDLPIISADSSHVFSVLIAAGIAEIYLNFWHLQLFALFEASFEIEILNFKRCCFLI